MKRRILWVLLVVSLAFNVAFLLGYLHALSTMRKSKTPEGRAQLLADRLELDGAQKEAYEQIRKAVLAEWERLDQEYDADANNKAFWAEMAKDEPDANRLHELRARAVEYRNEFERVRIDSLLKLQRLLRPEQRLKLRELIEDRQRPF